MRKSPVLAFASLILATLFGLSAEQALAQRPYLITDLGTLGGTYSAALGINDAGQIVGSSMTAVGAQRAFLHSGGVMYDLNSLIPDGSGWLLIAATGINDNGQIVGTGFINSRPSSFLLTPQGQTYSVTDLGDAFTFTDINNSGQMLCWSYNDRGGLSAYYYSDGTVTDLGALGGDQSQGFSISNSGQAVGWSITGGGTIHAFLHSGGVMNDLGTLGGPWSAAYGINDSGQVVGSSLNSIGIPHAFLYRGGEMIDLDSLLSGDPNWYLLQAAGGINSSDQIVGTGWTLPFFFRRAFLLTPTNPPPPPPNVYTVGAAPDTTIPAKS